MTDYLPIPLAVAIEEWKEKILHKLEIVTENADDEEEEAPHVG